MQKMAIFLSKFFIIDSLLLTSVSSVLGQGGADFTYFVDTDIVFVDIDTLINNNTTYITFKLKLNWSLYVKGKTYKVISN